MKISGGLWRGRPLQVPAGSSVRPTQDRVREALFSMIQFALNGCTFLDLFAGSGSVGLEALSRGATQATFVENAPASLRALSANIASLKAATLSTVIHADVLSFVRTPAPHTYDFIYADPPYELGAEKGYANMLVALKQNHFLVPGGFFMAEMKALQTPDRSPDWELCRDRTYGQTRLAVWQLKETPSSLH